ncbi:MAG: cob(I)yrinic acid a,c-diamide adenosyltransferase [Candidatus Cloacimonetes bacterium]|nr:cob(I)yrinic acid a,c-diamide adenosyltransferase [Candidatus Cloacimonadota bacterium]
MIQIYTGNGKGKTTAALGLILRALGRSWKVCLVQFMKKYEYGEIMELSKLPDIDVFQFGTPELIDPNSPSEIDIIEAEAGWKKAMEVVQSGDYNLVVVDEINVAVAWNLLSLDKQLQLMKAAKNCELIMTGRYAEEEVINGADLVTEMKEVKHYYHSGLNARKGIEF